LTLSYPDSGAPTISKSLTYMTENIEKSIRINAKQLCDRSKRKKKDKRIYKYSL